MPPVGFETMVSAGERSQIYALDRSATGIGIDSLEKLISASQVVVGNDM